MLAADAPNIADWTAAIGGVVGAIGGPAGLWAAWQVFTQNRRRRLGPPEELVELLAKVIDIANNVMSSPRGEQWFEDQGVLPLIDRTRELAHLVSDRQLRSSLATVLAELVLLKGLYVTHSGMSPEELTAAVVGQGQAARRLSQRARSTLEMLRKAL